MDVIGAIIAVSAAAFIGFNVLYIIVGRFDRLYILETVFISYALGIGLISIGMLKLYIFGMKFSLIIMLVPWTLLIVINLIRFIRCGRKLRFADSFSQGGNIGGYLDIFLKLGISAEVLYAFFRALIKPIESYDAIAIYAIKSKIFFLANAIPQNYFSDIIHAFPHPDYPLNIPLFETFIYMSMGGLNEQLVKIIFPLFFSGILGLLYYAVRRFSGRTYALLFTFLLASIPMFNSYAANAYHEVPLAFYCFSSALFLFTWLEDKSDLRSLIMSAVMVALAGWTKNEGMLYCAINIALVLAFSVMARKGSSKRSSYAALLYMAIIGIMLSPWIWIKNKYGLVNDEIDLKNLNPVYLWSHINRLGPTFYELQKQLFGPKKWILLWPVAIAAAIVNFKKIFSGVQKYISIYLLLAFCGYITFYMISYVDVVFFASKTWGRFMLHFLPLVLLWLAYMYKEDIKL